MWGFMGGATPGTKDKAPSLVQIIFSILVNRVLEAAFFHMSGT